MRRASKIITQLTTAMDVMQIDAPSYSHLIEIYNGTVYAKYLTSSKATTEEELNSDDERISEAGGRFRRFTLIELNEDGQTVATTEERAVSIPLDRVLFAPINVDTTIYSAPSDEAKRMCTADWKVAEWRTADQEVLPVYRVDLESVFEEAGRKFRALRAGRATPRSEFLKLRLKAHSSIAFVMALEDLTDSPARFEVGRRNDAGLIIIGSMMDPTIESLS